MKTDLYTKTILTVIAIALSAIAFQNVNFVSTATANTSATAPNPLPAPTQNSVIDVRIVGTTNDLPVKMGDPYSYSYKPLSVIVEKWSAGDLPVNVQSWSAGTLNVSSR